MNSEQYRAILKNLGLSVYASGRIIGISLRQSQRYAAGDAIPVPIARLLIMLDRHGIPAEWRAPISRSP